MSASVINPNLTPTIANAINATDRLRLEANAETFGHQHAVQAPGRVYGDAHALLNTLLEVAYGADAADVYDTMLDSGEDHAYAAAYIARQRREDALDASATPLTCGECGTGAYWINGINTAACDCGHEVNIALDVHPHLDRDEVTRTVDGVLCVALGNAA